MRAGIVQHSLTASPEQRALRGEPSWQLNVRHTSRSKLPVHTWMRPSLSRAASQLQAAVLELSPPASGLPASEAPPSGIDASMDMPPSLAPESAPASVGPASAPASPQPASIVHI